MSETRTNPSQSQIQSRYPFKIQSLLRILIFLWIIAGVVLPLIVFLRTENTTTLFSLILLTLPIFILFHDDGIIDLKAKRIDNHRKNKMLLILISIALIFTFFWGLGKFNYAFFNQQQHAVRTTTSALPSALPSGYPLTPIASISASVPTPIAPTRTDMNTLILLYEALTTFCNDVISHNYQDAYNNLFTPHLQKQISLTAFTRIFTATKCSYNVDSAADNSALATVITTIVNGAFLYQRLSLILEGDIWKIDAIQA